MARTLFKLAAVSRAIGVLGVADPNIGKSNVFMCELRVSGETVPVVFDSSLNTPLSSVSEDLVKFYFQKVTSTEAISVDFPVAFASAKLSKDDCTMSDSSIVVPVTVIDFPGVSIAVVETGPESTYFSTNSAVSTNRLEGSDKIDLIISKKGGVVDDRAGCLGNNADRMIMDMSSETSWEFGLESIGLLTKGETFLKLSDSTPKVTVATASEGLSFPETLFDQFKTSLESAGFKLVNGPDASTILDGCSDNNGLSKSLPALVLTFSKQQGYGVQVEPADYVEILTNGQCRLKVHKVSGSDIVLGDAFLKSGYVELNRAQRIMMACPNKQYHLSDKQFDPKIPVADRPAPRDATAADTPQSQVVTIAEERDQDSRNQALVIGLTVSGVVVMIAVVAFFVIRKRRAEKRKAATSQRFDPSRSMIHDPSEVSSVEGVGSAVVRV